MSRKIISTVKILASERDQEFRKIILEIINYTYTPNVGITVSVRDYTHPESANDAYGNITKSTKSKTYPLEQINA